MLTIRHATIHDVPRIVEMGERFRATSSYAEMPTNPAQMGQMAERIIGDPNGVILLAVREGFAVGMIALWVFPHYFSGVRTAAELVFWVEPEFRGCGLKLLRHAEAWASHSGAVNLHMIAPSPEIGHFYERLGYHRVEAAYQKDLTCPQRPRRSLEEPSLPAAP